MVKLNNIVRKKEATEARISDLEKTVQELGLKCKKTIASDKVEQSGNIGKILIKIETLEGQHDAMSAHKDNALCEEEKLGDERESIRRKTWEVKSYLSVLLGSLFLYSQHKLNHNNHQGILFRTNSHGIKKMNTKKIFFQI